MKILLFGKNGQVGWELQRSLAPLGELVALDADSRELCGDFTDTDGIVRTIRAVAPDVIVNAAAHTAVDKAESEPEFVRAINALAPGVLAQEAKRSNAWLIHYSTDYVFDGSGDKPWLETDKTAPLSVYGATKLEGEQLIQQAGCKHLIFRTSWVYGARGGNFAKTMLRLARERDSLTVIDDQIGAPTGADLLADVTAHAIRAARPELSGLYHLVAAGETSWHGYAGFVIDFARHAGMPLKIAPDAIRPVPTSAFPTAARRPLNSRLDTTRLQSSFGLTLPLWQNGVARMLAEILDSGEWGVGKPHEQLEAWKVAMQLAKAVYQMTSAFPSEERYGMAQQMRRAAVSIPSNIAEGAGRNGAKEYLHFIGIARGSLAELDTQMQLAAMLDFVKPDHAAFDLTDRTGKLLTGLHKKWSIQ